MKSYGTCVFYALVAVLAFITALDAHTASEACGRTLLVVMMTILATNEFIVARRRKS